MSMTYFVVVTFDRNDDGDLAAGEAQKLQVRDQPNAALGNSRLGMQEPSHSHARGTPQQVSLRTLLSWRNLAIWT
jgi:hypothetical protein